ncbi:MAG: glycosyltransferase family 1 protein [Patescibacteria group bacterium]|nr:glycosyltransferase family 1 protein [Patescibacteria group bacterium]
MRIGIDARFYGSLGKGLGRYTSELITQLEKLDTKNEYVVFLRKDNWDEYEPKNPHFTKVLAEYPWYTWKEQLLYPLFLRKFKLDLVHFPHFNVPLLYRRPFIVTVHDLILLSHPTTRATTLGPLLYKLKYMVYRLVIVGALKRSKAIITVSKTAKQEIEKTFPFTGQKDILVTYGACSPSLAEDTKGDKTKKVTQLTTPFALYVGNAYPHKNLERLLESFSQFRKGGYDDYSLVLIGAKDYFYERLREEARERGLDTNVIFFDHAGDLELAEIYRAASFYVFPSKCEGFGLPPLEAMCNGLPVASSDASCMPEILGEAALYFDADDAESMTGAMRRMAEDGELRQTLVDKGYGQAARYDWETVARLTLESYENSLK